ncbi:hypothetical protein VMCG_01171 [Cytospora schulzeri]|uniref:TauD/TfdA-like domain-containing protein n=1 Tax=Cytospora schulzeri TaxID=448051 RepID=A0A423X570_9PEZI|nr:hypothetical protein VMCG_01171 [Valsa malicola]
MSSITAQTVVSAPIANVCDIGATAGLDTLPKGFPSNIGGQLAWVGTDFANRNNWIYHLTDFDVDEVHKAVTLFKDLGLDGSKVGCDNFELPNLGKKLQQLSLDIHNGRGFSVIRGLNPADFSAEDLTLAYMGISAHIADKRGRQDRKGNMLVHIVADKANRNHHRHSTDPITFHNEETGDVISWLTRGTAATGGKCVIASAATIYNFLAATRPDLIRVLAREDWPFAFPRYHCRPVLFHLDGKLIMNFGRVPLMGSLAHPRKAHLPTLNTQQIEALDAIEAIARATEFQFSTQEGDLHFINNLSILHRRDGFADGVSSDQKRHLVRMRLRSSTLGYTIPQALDRDWADAFEKDGDRVWHIQPMPDGYFPLRSEPN